MDFTFEIDIPGYGEINDRHGAYAQPTRMKAHASALRWLRRCLSSIAPGYIPRGGGVRIPPTRLSDCTIHIVPVVRVADRY